MKTIKTASALVIVLLCAVISVHAQEFKEHISKRFTLQKPAAETLVGIYNLFGSVTVEGYAGNEVSIEIAKTIKAHSDEELEMAKKEFKLEFLQHPDSLIAYISGPWNTRPGEQYHQHDTDGNIPYMVKLDYTVKVPFNVLLSVNTVNEGKIDIKNVYGTLNIHNVNGGITIANAKGATHVRTVNGPVTVNYLAVPPDASSYYTLNGQLNVTYPANLSAQLQFKSRNGEVYTDFDNVVELPTQMEKSQNKERSGGTTYKLNAHPDVKVGAGGKLFKFETMNGNIYIKKQG